MTCNEDCHKPRGRQAHCGACHRTFTAVSPFDEHRRGGVCVIPEIMSEKNHVWGNYGTRPEWYRQ